MPYTYLTLAQARTQLAARLYDTSANLFWSDAEKNQYIVESIRIWNALTSFWRSEFTFQTQANVTWYDLTDTANLPNTLRPFTVTDNSLIQLIEYHLLEPVTSVYPLTWTGSLQFSLTDILNAIQRRRDEVLSATGCTITQRTIAAVPGRTFLPDTVIDIRRVSWLPVANPAGFTNSPLWPDDQWALQSYERDYTIQAPGTPSTYRQSTEPPLSFDTDIPPALPGQYDLLTVDAGVALSTVAATVLRVPDDFAWVIKWGALADLLGRESNAKDPTRAMYCEMRYRQGLALLLNSPAVLYARINNIPLDIDSLQNADNYRPGWQAETAAQPDLMMIAGLNLFGLASIPDAIYSGTLMVVENAPVPANDAAQIQIGRDDLEAILDHSQHLAAFKIGGSEFLSTLPLLDRFHKQAALYNSKLFELGEFAHPTYELSQLQQETNPTFTNGADSTAQAQPAGGS